jgi:hypothetical protein
MSLNCSSFFFIWLVPFRYSLGTVWKDFLYKNVDNKCESYYEELSGGYEVLMRWWDVADSDTTHACCLLDVLSKIINIFKIYKL